MLADLLVAVSRAPETENPRRPGPFSRRLSGRRTSFRRRRSAGHGEQRRPLQLQGIGKYRSGRRAGSDVTGHEAQVTLQAWGVCSSTDLVNEAGWREALPRVPRSAVVRACRLPSWFEWSPCHLPRRVQRRTSRPRSPCYGLLGSISTRPASGRGPCHHADFVFE